MKICDLFANDKDAIEAVAASLMNALPHAWPDMQAALAEVHECFDEGRTRAWSWLSAG